MAKTRIYHYTSVSGFVGIIEQGHIWLSDASKMNDYSEVAQGIKIVRFFLDENPELEGAPLVRLALDYITFANFYICSFSKHPDSLSQWRAYAQDGKGVALGFEVEKSTLEESYQTTDEDDWGPLKLHLLDVEYAPNGHRLWQNSGIYQALLETITRQSVSNIEQVIETIEKIYGMIVRAKNDAFSEEEEVRIACWIHRKLEWGKSAPGYGQSPYYPTVCKLPLSQRCTNDDIVRYLPLPVNGSGMKLVEVVKGPQCKITDHDIRLLVESRLHHDRLKLTNSLASYRSG